MEPQLKLGMVASRDAEGSAGVVWRGDVPFPQEKVVSVPSPDNCGILFAEIPHSGAFLCTSEQNLNM